MKKMVSKTIDLGYKSVCGVSDDQIRYGSLDAVINSLQVLKNEFGGEAELDISTDDADCVEITITYQREETDQEYTGRLQKEKLKEEKLTRKEKLKQEELTRKAKLQQDSEYQTYLELKSKFGGI